MNDLKRVVGEEILTQNHVRFFVQPGGPGPSNPVLYSGASTAYMNIENVSNPIRGGITRINVHDPRVIGRFRAVGTQEEAPDYASATVQFYQKKDALPRHLTELLDCYVNFYQVVGSCKDPSDFLSGWSAYTKTFNTGRATEPTEAGGSFDGTDPLQDDIDFTFLGGVSNVGKLGFSEKASVEVYSQVKGVTYGNRIQCQACGPSDNGTGLIYAVTDNTVASVGQAPAVYYSTDGGLTWTEQAITGAASTDFPTAITTAGNYLIITFDDSAAGDNGGYWYSEISSITGIPSSTWTTVTTGFVLGAAPQDVHVVSASEIWFAAKFGYIYKSTNILSGVTVVDAGTTTTATLARIDALDEVVVAVSDASDASGTDIVYSRDRGNSWTTTTTTPGNATDGYSAIQIMNDYLWWVAAAGTYGTDAYVYYTMDGGETWTLLSLPSAIYVDDIRFITQEVGYITVATSGPTAKIYSTWNGGYSWTNTSPRVLNVPTADRFNRIAVPVTPNLNVAVNNVVVGGLAGNGSDGLIMVGSAAVQ